MSSRALRRLNRSTDVDAIRVSEKFAESEEEVKEEPGFVSQACKRKDPALNLFSLVSVDV